MCKTNSLARRVWSLTSCTDESAADAADTVNDCDFNYYMARAIDAAGAAFNLITATLLSSN